MQWYTVLDAMGTVIGRVSGSCKLAAMTHAENVFGSLACAVCPDHSTYDYGCYGT